MNFTACSATSPPMLKPTHVDPVELEVLHQVSQPLDQLLRELRSEPSWKVPWW
jgi:hypothetical protein